MYHVTRLALSLTVLGSLLSASPAFAWPPRPRLPSLPRPSLPSVPQIRLPDPRSWTDTSDNISEKRQDLRREYRAVILGKHINHVEYLRFGSAVAAAVATENPGPVLQYLQQFLAETKAELRRNGNREAQRVAQQLTNELMVRLLDSAYRGRRPQLYEFHGVKVRVGLVTYSHYKKIVTEYPYISAGRVKWRKDENRISLPNTHQLYVGIDF
jgi:hypothetical protein